MIAIAGRFASLALLVALVQSTAAQAPMDESTFDKLLADVHIHEVSVDAPYRVKVMVSRGKAEGKMGPEEYIFCERSSPDAEYIAVQVLDLKTDDRWAVKPGACDALLAAARRRKDAQGK
jgi:hypothetical protein